MSDVAPEFAVGMIKGCLILAAIALLAVGGLIVWGVMKILEVSR